MAIRKKTDEELQNQVEWFLEYEKWKRKIDKEKSKELFDILLNKESISASKEQTKDQLVWVLNSEEYDWLYKDYCEWLKKSNKVRKNIIEKILPKKYLFLSNENFLKNYFMDSEFDDKDIENYRIKIEKNIWIFKKYIGDSLLKEFIEVIVKYKPEYIEEVLLTLNKIWINSPDDVIKMKEPIFDGIRGENLITLNEIWINKPGDLVRLKWILRYGDSSMIKKKIDALKSIWITSVDNLVKLEKIIKEGHYVNKSIHSRFRGPLGFITIWVTDDDVIANMMLIWNLWGSVENLVKLENVVCNGKLEKIKKNIEALKECWIITIDDLAKLQKTIIEGEPEVLERNIEALKECWIITVDDLAKFQDCIIKWESEVIKEGIEILKYCGITSVDDWVKLQKIISEKIEMNTRWVPDDLLKKKRLALLGNNLHILMEDELIKSIDDIAKLQDIIMVWLPNKVKWNIDTLKGLWITSVDDLTKLKEIITFWESEMILLLKEIWITSVDDLVKLDGIICSFSIVPENVRANIETLKEIGVEISVDNLGKIGIIVCSDETDKIRSNLLTLKEVWITEVKDLKELNTIIRRWDSKILATLKEVWITEVKDLKELESFIRYGEPEKIRSNLLTLKEVWITEVKDLKELENLICYGEPEKIRSNLLILKELWIMEVSDLKKLNGNITPGRLNYIACIDLNKTLNLIYAKYPDITKNEVRNLKNLLFENEYIVSEIKNFWDELPSLQSINLLNLINDNTDKHDEIFESIEGKDEINDDNWIDITWLYSAIEYFEDDETISDEIKSSIRGLINNEDKKDFIKNFIYKKLTELLKKCLLDKNELNNEEIALLAVLNKKWLFNMWQSESLAKFVYQINKLDKNYKFWKAYTEIKWDIKKFINSHKKDSNDLMTSFFQISTSLLEESPAVYRNLIELLNKLDSDEQAIFFKEVFPLYNVELFLWEKEWKLLWISVNNDVEWQLIPMHERIKMLLNKLKTDEEAYKNTLLSEEKNNLVENIKQLFKEKFWIKKFPNEFTNENIESIKWHSIYLSNMNDCDEEKSAVLWYFLALKLDWKRSEFRSWKDFDPSEYMDDSKVSILREYLSNRSERNSLYKLENIEEWDKVILQENESNTIIWNTNWITDRLHTIEDNIKTLLDDDIYSERQKIIKKYVDKNLGKLLAKQFQILSGKDISLSNEEKQTLSEVANELWDNLTDIKNVQKLQNECKPISATLNFVNKILNENLPKEIQNFENLCKPSDEHLKLLRKLWINLENDLIVSSNSYITYIESWIRKWKNKLTKEEYDSLNEYIIRVNKELGTLYDIKDKLTTLYEDFKNKIIDKYFDNTELKERFESMSPYFFTKADVEKENIVSLMTNDLDIVIKNIRQCLWCKNKWCNNDTDLSFGCDDRFFITTSHREWDTSFADELVTLLPRSPKEEWFTFVMDKIYWNNWSTDILLNNIHVILKKINKLSPGIRKNLSIFVPDGIGLTLNADWIEKIKKQYNWINIDQQEVTVTVESQPITDSYHEFWWIDPRSTWDAKISWYLIKME